jgi:hypothetical protein
VTDLANALAPLGFTFAELRGASEQLVLFGSRAAGLSRTASDWDLLAVGAGRSCHTPTLDLIWVSERELATPTWLAGELAAHVARWGRWLHGTPDWTAEVRCGEAARARKARRLASRLAALEKAWSLLPAATRIEERILLRRDLQRHALLAEGQPVPPSRMLDDAWTEGPDQAERMLDLAARAGVCSAFCEALARVR